MVPELRGQDVSLSTSFDIWSAAMTLIVAADRAVEYSLYIVQDVPDPMLMDSADDDDDDRLMKVFDPNWATIEATDFLSPYLDIFKTCFTDSNTRTSADIVIRYLLTSESNARKAKGNRGTQQ
jgi:hypothetical protein